MTTRIEDDRLQQYFDGELPEAEADEVRRTLDASEEEQARLEQLERLRGLVRLAAEEAAREIPTDALFSRIEAGVAKDQWSRSRMRVVTGIRQRRRRTAGVVAVALAAAALLAFLWPRQTGPEIAGNGTDERVPLFVVDEHPPGTEVVDVDFGANTGTVFAVEGDGGEPVAVVWISEEKAP
jgi:hypothetical protein